MVRMQGGFFERDESKNILKNITMEKCDRKLHLGEYAGNLSENFDLSNYYCVPPDKFNFSLYGVYGDKINRFSNFEIYVTKCFNDGMLPKVQCLNNSVIDKSLKRVIINIMYVDSQIDHDNLESPFKYNLKSVFVPSSATVYRKYVIRRKTVTYTSDFGLFTENIKKLSFFQFDYTESNTDLRVDDVSFPVFFQFSINFSDTNDCYKRKFIRLQSLFGTLGFIYKFIFFIGGEFTSYFIKKGAYLAIYDNIFAKNEKYSIADIKKRK